MSSLRIKIESLLLVSDKPLTTKIIVDLCGEKSEIIKDELNKIQEKYNQENSGICLIIENEKAQFVTNPKNSDLIKKFLKSEISGELTRPQLESLTVIAYRGPITKPELEQIRGVNCSLILRNLLASGLIDGKENKEKMQIVYRASFDFMKFLGIAKIEDLPDYEILRNLK